MLLDPSDLAFQNLDPLLKLGDRQGPEVLADEQAERVARPAGEEIVVVHHVGQR